MINSNLYYNKLVQLENNLLFITFIAKHFLLILNHDISTNIVIESDH